jgi:hypothetical protein
MNLSRLIDLIAEVAAKRTAREGKNQADKPRGTVSTHAQRTANEPFPDLDPDPEHPLVVLLFLSSRSPISTMWSRSWWTVALADAGGTPTEQPSP